MVQITPTDAFVFFGGILMGALIGILGNFLVSSFFKLNENIDRNLLKKISYFALVVLIILMGFSLWAFDWLKNA